VRPLRLVLILVLTAAAGGAAALGLGAAFGWVGDDDAPPTQVVVTSVVSPPAAAPAAVRPSASPLSGTGFDAARLYAERSAGVVTIYAFFGEVTEEGGVPTAQGSGFVASSDGYVLTNSHVITTAGEGSESDARPANQVYVQFADGDRVEAEVVGWDVFADVGLLKVDREAQPLAVVPLGDSASVVVGEPVAAIGSPFGNRTSLAVGVVSATNRSIPSLTSDYRLPGAIQTDAPISRGNSGGPLFDARGRVIGINAQIRSESGFGEGVGFAIPINTARRSMRELIETGHVAYSYVGITTEDLTPSIAREFGYPVDRGAMIVRVRQGSPGDRAGLRGSSDSRLFRGLSVSRGGDIVIAIGDTPVQNADELVQLLAQSFSPGDTATFKVIRGRETRTIRVVLGERPARQPA
jgi:2-alkenal reductase